MYDDDDVQSSSYFFFLRELHQECHLIQKLGRCFCMRFMQMRELSIDDRKFMLLVPFVVFLFFKSHVFTVIIQRLMIYLFLDMRVTLMLRYNKELLSILHSVEKVQH